jgi:bifunctional non-homologous end joining protein LigD
MNNEKLFAKIPPELLKKLKKIPFPSFIPPMLATLTTNYFSSKDWFYEHKYDGVRCLAFKNKGKIRLLSRNNIEMNDEYPEIVTALQKQKADNFIIDGEIVALEHGISNFQLLQGRMHLQNAELIKAKSKSVQITFCIFDALYVHGYDIRPLALYARKDILKKLLSYNKTLIFSEHKIGDGVAYFKKACRLKWEGIMAKRKESVYVSARSRDWLKFKCVAQQELVIGGFTDPQGSRPYFGALLVGYYQNDKLMYAGKVGTGFSYQTLTMLGPLLRKLEIKTCPFANFDISPRGIHWVKPVLVGEFQFAQWTKGNKLRVGRFKGLREDKDAKDVVKEVPGIINK